MSEPRLNLSMYRHSKLALSFVLLLSFTLLTFGQAKAGQGSLYKTANDTGASILDMPELESLLSLSTPDALEKLVSRIETQDAKTLATLMILLHRKSEHISLLVERNKMLQDKERLEQEEALQEKAIQLSQAEAKHAAALLKKEETIEKLKQRIEQLLVNRSGN